MALHPRQKPSCALNSQVLALNVMFTIWKSTFEYKNRFFAFTAPFNNMRTLTFKAQPTNAFFATVNQVFGDSSQLPTTVERAVIKSLSTVQITKQCSAVVGS